MADIIVVRLAHMHVKYLVITLGNSYILLYPIQRNFYREIVIIQQITNRRINENKNQIIRVGIKT